VKNRKLNIYVLTAFIISLSIVSLAGCRGPSGQPTGQITNNTNMEPTTTATTIPTTSATTVLTKQFIYSRSFVDRIYDKKVESLTTLQQEASAIVKGTVLKTDPPMDSEYYMPSRYTTIRIDQVFSSYGLNVGDTLEVAEYYTSTPDKNNQDIIHISSVDASIPLMQDHQYLLFLERYQGEGKYYGVAFSYLGKFPITDNTLSHKFRDLSVDEMEFPQKPEIWTMDLIWESAAQAFDKYLAN
jgi:hypothetical protein